ncbi:MbnP family protein [Hymenobacter crusticola]|uniref:Copper-binding protein MbnP-like domain-containing protein n=1 Tax=Hymenobacter crusticola TaxID=1770526 RepID=A0A243WBM9_9BACT|nr:MbnP family protein [Hymenobacter crusticola]OUJ72418.1 hypothetical protein BXP70_17785 [Hymenobacter crusticola]
MLFSKLSSLWLALAFTAITFTSCDKDDTTPADSVGGVDIEFDNVVGNSPLALNTGNYTTAAGDQFTVTTFNYYISNIRLTKADGTAYVQPDSYYLVSQADDASKHLSLKDVPVGDYTGITFTIGVDSTRNVSGAQTGALDPSNNMFWTWNSGYIFMKLEGTSPQASRGGLLFHIGGFQHPYNTIRTISPSFNGTTLMVRTDHSPEIHMQADVLKMFASPNQIRFANLSNSMGGATSVQVADNYSKSGMFTVAHIHAN